MGPFGKADAIAPSLSTVNLGEYVRCRGALGDAQSENYRERRDRIECEASDFAATDAVDLDGVGAAVGSLERLLGVGDVETIFLGSEDADEDDYGFGVEVYPASLRLAAIFSIRGDGTYVTEQRFSIQNREALASFEVSVSAPVEVWRFAFHPSAALYQGYYEGVPSRVTLSLDDRLPLQTESISAFDGRAASEELRVRLYAEANRRAYHALEDTIMSHFELVVPAGSERVRGTATVGPSTMTIGLSGSGHYVVGLDGSLQPSAAENLPRLSGAARQLDGGVAIDGGLAIEGSPALYCEGRDRPGHAPWILAVQSGEQSPVRVARTSVGSIEQCRDVTYDAVGVGERIFACIPRDDDGGDPWVIAALDRHGSLQRLEASLRTLEDCQSSLHAGVVVSDDMAFRVCGSRDGDSRAPYVVFDIRAGGDERASTDLFDDLDSCIESLAP